MKNQAYSYLRIFSISVALGLASCGGAKGKSAALGVSVVPEQPIVFTGNGSNFSGQTITAPWFSFAVQMTNPTEESITIIGLQVEVTSQDTNGDLATSTFTWTPADWNHSYSDTIGCTYNSFGTIAAGTQTNTPFLLEMGTVNECDVIPVFTPNSIPSGPFKNNFNYRVKIKPLGWFGTFLTPTDRLEKFKYFSTR